MTYISTKELPKIVQSVLSSVGYHGKDIEIVIKEDVSVYCSGGDGYRYFAMIVDLSTNDVKRYMGSWAGANQYNLSNRVDLDDKNYVIPENVVVIIGHEGGTSPVRASLTISPKNIVPGLLPANSGLSDKERWVLGVFKSMTPAYRKEALSSYGEVVDKLVVEGYLKRSKNGATQITTLGKNNAKSVCYGSP